jgi:dipeptidyl aminopeptidase/acylaminoacyl peptidase
MRLRPAFLAFAAFAATTAGAQTPITLDQAMAHPDWIGPPVDSLDPPYWSWDGKQAIYKLKRAGSPVKDTWTLAVDGGEPRLAEPTELATLDAKAAAYDSARTRMLFVRHGDVFERDLRSGALTQITRSAEAEASPQYASDGRRVQYRVGNDWYAWDPARRLSWPVALPKAAKDPEAAPAEDSMRDMQLRLSSTLARLKSDREALRAEEARLRAADPGRAASPVYLGDAVDIDGTMLSPDGRWLLVVTSPKDAEAGRVGKLPLYVTESGYEEFEDERTRVGRALPSGEGLLLVDLADHSTHAIALDPLPGIAVDPLAALRAAQKLDPLKGNRAVRVLQQGDNSGADTVHWSADGARVGIMLRAVDNKDRWIATLEPATLRLSAAHRLTDPGWINWNFNDFGWLPDNRTLWYLSEESGFSHLYTRAPGGAARQLTNGRWENSAVAWSPDGARAYFLCNRETPGDYEVCSVGREGGAVRELTALDGVEAFALSPDGNRLLVTWSAAYTPPQLAVLPAAGGETRKLTDTRTAAFRARSWIEPQYVAVPSKHGAGVIWSKLYRPATLEPGRKYPVVMFVHGAGYLQNASKRYPNYFREQMFHNLLVQQGYIVLDMDYRASEGYGRDWRNAIYRRMGTPELEDYLDGVDWMVANQQGDPANVGIYGGSYGGFMAFMAMFKKPEVFKAGAGLRPVTDWTSYNHEYTANILNTPDVDPEAYRRSSPIEFAEGLQGHLLIMHGMMDDNVFYQDSVRLAQRLIELKKDHWELASYPLERHSFVHPESWYDEYRRIYQLFERTLK